MLTDSARPGESVCLSAPPTPTPTPPRLESIWRQSGSCLSVCLAVFRRAVSVSHGTRWNTGRTQTEQNAAEASARDCSVDRRVRVIVRYHCVGRLGCVCAARLISEQRICAGLRDRGSRRETLVYFIAFTFTLSQAGFTLHTWEEGGTFSIVRLWSYGRMALYEYDSYWWPSIGLAVLCFYSKTGF